MDNILIRRIQFNKPEYSYMAIRIYSDGKYQSFRCDDEKIIFKAVREMSKFVDKERKRQ